MTPQGIGQSCCCPSTGGGDSAASVGGSMGGGFVPLANAYVAAPTRHDHSGVTPVQQVGRGSGPGVRDRDKAQASLNQIRQAVARFESFDTALASGYERNPASGDEPIQHFLNSGVFQTKDAGNLAMPATLMYEFGKGAPRLVGVMLSADPNGQLPDFGAGAWHRHPGDDQVHMHVWFDRGLDAGAFENVTGYI